MKRRFCDGGTCVHRIAETVAGIEYGRGEVSDCLCDGLPEDSKERCSYSAILKAYVVTPDGKDYLSPKIYGFKTGSINSGDSIVSELRRLDFLYRQANNGAPSLGGRLFTLSVRMVSGKESTATKFPIWGLSAFSFETPALPDYARHALDVADSHAIEEAEIVDPLEDEGREFYGTEWDTKARELVRRITDGRTESTDDLKPDERKRLIDGIRKKAKEATPA